MKINSKTLAQTCVALLIIYPVSTILVWAYLRPDDSYGTLAALFALNAATAFFVEHIFRLPRLRQYAPKELRYFVLLIGLVCALMAAQYWMTDEVHNVWLRLGIMSPVLLILLVLMWFAGKVDKEKAENADSR